MPPSTKKRNHAHRVPCVCCLFNCYLGHYVDTYGVTQAGVEVLPETFAAHELADRANKATSSLSGQQHATATHHDLNHSLDQDTLTGRIACLQLKENDKESKSSTSYPVSQQKQFDDLATSTSRIRWTNVRSKDNDDNNPQLVDDLQEPLPDLFTGATLREPLSQDPIEPTRRCLEATSAKESGVKVYECGKLDH